jgi:hypothetical protein
MNAYASSGGRYNSRIEEWVENAEAEIRHAVTYIDRVIVPGARRESAGAARVLARYLDRMADKLHPQNGPDGKEGQ